MSQAAQTQAPAPAKLTPMQKNAVKIQEYLKRKQGTFEALLPAHLKPEKMMKGFWAAAARNPKIVECSPESVLNCFLVSASLGLEIGRMRGGMHVVPFNNKGVLTLTPIPDYRGLMDLAYRSGQVKGIRAVAVYDGDLFEYEEGTADGIRHVPKLDTDRSPGKLKYVYAVAHLEGARPQFVVMTRQEVEQHRARSRAKESGPWVSDYVAMALKTVIKALTNWLPTASEKLIQAVELDDRAERGEDMAGVFDFELTPEPQGDDPESRTEKVKRDLEARQSKSSGDGAEQNKQETRIEGGGDVGTAKPATVYASNFDPPEHAVENEPKGGPKSPVLATFRKSIQDAYLHGDVNDWWTQTGHAQYVQATDPKVREKMAELGAFYCGPTFTAE